MKTHLHFFYFALVFGSLLFFSNGFAQTAPLEYYIQTYEFESESYDGDGTLGSNPIEIPIGVIELHEIPWMQLHFSKVNLGNESYIIIKSLYDDQWQKLDAISMKQWNNYSAFFNGSAVDITLFLAQTDRQVFIKIDEIVVGEWYQGVLPESQCGPTDDRIASNQPATARLLSIGCTAWIIPNGKFATAGHCLDGRVQQSLNLMYHYLYLVEQYNIPVPKINIQWMYQQKFLQMVVSEMIGEFSKYFQIQLQV